MSNSEYEVERSLIRVGDSLAVVIPPIWARARGLSKGHKVTVAFDSYDYLKIKAGPSEADVSSAKLELRAKKSEATSR